MVALREEGKLIGYYEKHEYRNTHTQRRRLRICQQYYEKHEYRNTETMKRYDLW
ncbi:MAG: hypothetical protein MR355_10995 [Lachnospiraceae bacterium]|nr:hypothetical protein [Lachnospiraceae bacterium]